MQAPDALLRGIEYVHAAGVPGDVAEFGCFLGESAKLLAQGLAVCDAPYRGSDQHHGIAERRLWLFDSFEGLPTPTSPVDEDCPHVVSGAWGPGCLRGATPQGVIDACSAHIPARRITVGAGWFAETLPLIPKDARFAFVHVDCDLYLSAHQVLEHLFANGHLSDGCALYFDDWYCNRGSPEFGEQKAFAEIQSRFRLRFRLTDWGAYGVVGHRFIVHGS